MRSAARTPCSTSGVPGPAESRRRRLLELGRAEGQVTEDIDLQLLTTAWLGTFQQFARFRYFGEFKQPAAVLADTLEALLTKMVRP